jgi:FkbM family methyltransferase
MKNILLFTSIFSVIFGATTYDDLVAKKLIAEGDKPKLHLGCGQTRIEGYINIDFPMENRNLHTINTADYNSDISILNFPMNSISAIESHHIFEHFSRPESLALLVAWHYWLEPNSELIIETPDFEKAIRRFIRNKSQEDREIIQRHIFGSQEANWALHKDGWSAKKFEYFLNQLGYVVTNVDPHSWNILDNITVKAIKKENKNLEELKESAKGLLKLGLVDSSNSELKMWEGWCNDFENALEKLLPTELSDIHIPENSIIFDVGAHVGAKTINYLKTNPKLVLAIEPQPWCINILEKKFETNPKVKIIPNCLSDKEGYINLDICTSAPTISTCSDNWKKGRFSNYTWDKRIEIKTTTLDTLIKKYGTPFYCKIDVEGFELSVLKGLTKPIPLISFEFTKEFIDETIKCIQYLESLGMKKFNFKVGENSLFASDYWLDSGSLIKKLTADPDALLWGDIYAYRL